MPFNSVDAFPVTLHSFKEARNEYYMLKGNSCGGRLHVVLDDFNVRDIDLTYCHELCREERDWLGMKILECLNGYGEADREKLVRGEDV